MRNPLAGAGNSPATIAAIGGTALVGAVYFMSKRAPAQVTTASNMPFSFDALANWLAGRNGGIGNPPNPGPAPLPGPGPDPNPDPCAGPLGLLNPACHPALPGLCGPGYHQEGGPESPCVPDAMPSRGGFADMQATAYHDTSYTEQPVIPVTVYPPGVGGQARAYGLDLDNMYSARYNLLFALQSTDRPEESAGGAAH